MPRARRWFRSKRVYELCFRAREGLPMPALKLVKVLLESALARTQRDGKVEICHGLGMANHPHILVVSNQGENLASFYEELKKKITDAIKRLLGLDHLSLWEEGHEVAEILDVDKVMERIVYYYLNPSAADLVDTVEEFPGLSTWGVFKQNLNKLEGSSEKLCPWIRLPSIPKLPSNKLTENQDNFFTEKLLAANKAKHKLIISPNAWMKVFGITSEQEILQVNQEIVARVREGEKASLERRKAQGKKAAGAYRLRTEAILKPHKPKKKQKRIYVLSSQMSLRIAFLQEFKEFCAQCRECFLAWRRGASCLPWPPGAFRPAMPPLANALCFDS